MIGSNVQKILKITYDKQLGLGCKKDKIIMIRLIRFGLWNNKIVPDK